jgi:hypothetical protein
MTITVMVVAVLVLAVASALARTTARTTANTKKRNFLRSLDIGFLSGAAVLALLIGISI